MKRREFITLLGGAAAAWPLTAHAQHDRVLIAFLGSSWAESSAPLVAAFKQGMRENGLIEGKDYLFEARWAEGAYERFPTLTRELVDRVPSVLIVGTITAARAAQRATSTIPIVMASMNDPVGQGLVASLSKPGGNTTGLANLYEDATPKLLELLRDTIPKSAVISAILNPGNPSNRVFLANLRAQSGNLNLSVRSAELTKMTDLDAVMAQLVTPPPDALLLIPDAAVMDLGDRIVKIAMRNGVPVFSPSPDLVDVGALVGYGASRRENYRRSAYYVKRILDGARPGDLPVEQPTRIVLSVNLKTAKALGLTVPPQLLARADEVIE